MGAPIGELFPCPSFDSVKQDLECILLVCKISRRKDPAQKCEETCNPVLLKPSDHLITPKIKIFFFLAELNANESSFPPAHVT